jgi:hypothetical protein
MERPPLPPGSYGTVLDLSVNGIAIIVRRSGAMSVQPC